MTSSVVEVVVRGRMGGALTHALEGFDVHTDAEGLTHIVGRVVDQPRLLAILQTMNDLHVELVSINPFTTGSEVSPPTGDARGGGAH